MPGSLLGNRVPRVEDPDLLTGKATFVANLPIQACAVAAFVRSPVAHARLAAVDTGAARRAPGVLAVYTADDAEALGLTPLRGGGLLHEACARAPLTGDRVRFVGDTVAIVVAETEAQAADAAELVEVDYEVLPVVADAEAAVAAGAPVLFESIGTNVVAGWRDPDGEGATDPLAGAATVVRAQLENQRVAVVPLEADAIAAVPGDDGDGHELTVYLSTQMPHELRKALARYFGIEPRDRLRVVAPHVGGAFGGKAVLGAEHVAVVAAARHLGRPVRWVETRSESFVGMPQGRGQVQWVELGFDDGGRITGMHCRVLADGGAYAGFGGGLALGPTRMMIEGVYLVPAVRYDVASVVTNTTPMGAFRGAGRPEAAELVERMMDIAAAELGVEPVELRRRNLRPAFSEPVTSTVGTTYDTGDYEKALAAALAAAGYEDLRAEQAARRARGDARQLGVGVSVYAEITGFGGSELGAVEIGQDGTATVRVGTSAHGQGHATAFSMLVADTLGIPMEAITFVQSDTAAVERGGGTGGSRSLQLGGTAVLRAAETVLERARELAAAELEADPADVVVHDDGRLGVAGVPARSFTWAELAAFAERDGGEPLHAQLDVPQAGATFPFGAHVSVVEVDTETGKVRPLRHVAVDDCGRILNPMIVAGQQQGGIAQGMAQALWEEMVYDAQGNPLTATLADYGMPSAAELPSFETSNTETPTPLNPLGAKGIGESGTIGATPAVHNAVVDALAHLGVRHVAMPCTPQRVWKAIDAARLGSPDAAGGGRPLWRDPPAAFDALPVRGATDQPEALEV